MSLGTDELLTQHEQDHAEYDQAAVEFAAVNNIASPLRPSTMSALHEAEKKLKKAFRKLQWFEGAAPSAQRHVHPKPAQGR